MSQEVIVRVLELAGKGELPDQIEDDSVVPVTTVKELYDAGYLEAIDISSSDGIGYMEPRITLAGRQYLERLGSEQKAASFSEKIKRSALSLGNWVAGILAALFVAWVSWQFFQ